MSSGRPSADFGPSQHLLLLLFTAAAVLAGVYARFKGLGTWPLAVDEYYIARSVENLLQFGVPAYECGGYYTRGLPYQYAVAALQLAGTPPELSARLIAAAASLLALPAIYILGRRTHGPAVGLVAVALVALSVWEVEMARFGRMYAPFQTIFVWYLVFFLRYTLDRQHGALLPMVLLSVLGALTWEGGIFLALLNLLPPFLGNASGRLARNDWAFLGGMTLLLLPLLWFATAELRLAGPEPALPSDFERSESARALAALDATQPPWRTLAEHPLWAAIALVPLAAAGYALRWVWQLRHRWIAAAGLLAALGAAVLHQYAAVATIVLLLLLTGLVRREEFAGRAARPYLH